MVSVIIFLSLFDISFLICSNKSFISFGVVYISQDIWEKFIFPVIFSINIFSSKSFSSTPNTLFPVVISYVIVFIMKSFFVTTLLEKFKLRFDMFNISEAVLSNSFDSLGFIVKASFIFFIN